MLLRLRLHPNPPIRPRRTRTRRARSRKRRNPLLLNPDLRSLSAIILNELLEPRMLEGFSRGDAFLGVVDEDLEQQVEEQAVEGVGGRDDLREALHAAHEFPRVARGLWKRVGEAVVLEEARGAVAVRALA